jgi:3-hydroxybutyrate dehydrogenase
VAIVTAAGQGIGKAIAKSFAEAGATVAVVDIDAEGADNVADEISNGGGLAYALAVDVTKSNNVDAMVNGIRPIPASSATVEAACRCATLSRPGVWGSASGGDPGC